MQKIYLPKEEWMTYEKVVRSGHDLVQYLQQEATKLVSRLRLIAISQFAALIIKLTFVSFLLGRLLPQAILG